MAQGRMKEVPEGSGLPRDKRGRPIRISVMDDEKDEAAERAAQNRREINRLPEPVNQPRKKFDAAQDAADRRAMEEAYNKATVYPETQDALKKAKGGSIMKDSKSMMAKEIGFMKKKGAPKAMIQHEEAEAKTKAANFCRGGGVEVRGKTKGRMV